MGGIGWSSHDLTARGFGLGQTMVAVWICLCAYLSCLGWGLSALHMLNRAGYAAALVLAAGAGAACYGHLRLKVRCRCVARKLRRRFTRFFPATFLAVACLAILGGVLHAPNNLDALAYRVPRVLDWLAEGRWHWIHTDFQALNTRACGMEWLSAPLIAFTRTDRFLFLINALSFLLLPGLMFSVLTRLGIRPRAAWHWMWLIPTGYCYVLQAGSVSNDMFSAVFALAAVDFALRARKSGRISEVLYSMLSAALLTGTKASNLPLLLPWIVALAPTWRIWTRHLVAVGATTVPALGASFVPTAALNWYHCGDWTGLAVEPVGIGTGPAWLHLFNNAVTTMLGNLVPPVFPFASAWNHLADRLIPSSLAPLLQRYFEQAAAHWRLDEMQIEEAAGLGFGVTLLLGVSLVAVTVGRGRSFWRTGAASDRLLMLVRLAPWLSSLCLMVKLGLAGVQRYLAPYYPLLLAGLLLGPGHEGLIRRRWWRAGASVVFGLTALLLVLSPARPLWPANWFVNRYQTSLERSALGARAITVYDVYADRADAFAPVLQRLPGDARVLGLCAFHDPETSLWRPFGSRRIFHVCVRDSAERTRARGIRYVLVRVTALHEPWDQWRRRMGATVLQTMTLRLRAGQEPSRWELVELNSASSHQTVAPVIGESASLGIDSGVPAIGEDPGR